MKAINFDTFDPISIVTFSSLFKRTSFTIGVQEGAIICLLHFLFKNVAAGAFKGPAAGFSKPFTVGDAGNSSGSPA